MALTTETSTYEADAVAAERHRLPPTRPGPAERASRRRRAVGAAGSSPNRAAAGRTQPKAKPAPAAETKTSSVLKKLRSPKGVTIDALMETTGWQVHSVRGFLSAVVRKKLGLNLVSEIGKDGVRRYHIGNADKAK